MLGQELDPLKLHDTAFEEVANLPRAGVVAMSQEPNDSHLGVAVPALVNHTISPRPRRSTPGSGGPPSPERHAVIDQSSAELDLHLFEAA